ncbi:MAG: tRNA lysidine(34) synthetase TilS [Alphaproteobacteria bacterium]|nr:tRNA lysidine(34) synthetase TilS [Alphaproteobacteria bacterium]
MPRPRPLTPPSPRARQTTAADQRGSREADRAIKNGVSREADRATIEQRFAAVMEEFAAGGAWPGAVALSGGGDSVGLLHLIVRWAKKTKKTAPLALVVDHGLRPEAAREARGVVKAAQAMGLEAVLLRWHAPSTSGVEAAARQARYRLMGEALAKKKLTTLYVGHTEDDQAETFLLRLARGSGLDGLSAMRALAPWPVPGFAHLTVARPLLGFRREELRGWLTARKLNWLEDPMNADPRFARVKIRALAPALAEAGLSSGRIALAARHMAAAREALELVTAAVLERAVRPTPQDCPQPGLLLDPAALAAAPRELSLRALAALLQLVSGTSYRPRFAALERLHGQLVAGHFRGATLSGCAFRPAPANERLFGPATLKLTPEKRRWKGSV